MSGSGEETTVTKWVYSFAEGNAEMKDLLGGKGANLAEMTNMGIPVPPGFTITTESCRYYHSHREPPAGMWDEVQAHVLDLEAATGRGFGDAERPLLLSVRSGAKFSMPGMMDTVLDIGLNDETVIGLARQADDDHFAWDSYRRLVQMYGKTDLGAPSEPFDALIEAAMLANDVKYDVELPAAAVKELTEAFKQVVVDTTGQVFPQDPLEQLQGAVQAVFDSWDTPRAKLYRRQEGIPQDLGTAVNIQVMVFGNVGEGSGTGVAFTRDPATGERGVYGDYLADAQGEDVVAGIRNTSPLSALGETDPQSYEQLLQIMADLEEHYADLCDIEFTVQEGKLWMLQVRVGKRTPAAAFRIAAQLVDEGLIDLDEAVRRVTGQQLAQLLFPQFDPTAPKSLIAEGMGASPGAAVGEIVFDSAVAVRRHAEGHEVILVRPETSPDDLAGMVASAGILTSRGGKTSHAAVVARGMGKTAVCGADSLRIDTEAGELHLPDGRTFFAGTVISIDGSDGEVYEGSVPVRPSAVVEYFENGLEAALEGVNEATAELLEAVDRIMRHADENRRMQVRANADTATDARRAREMGAQGIGLCRTEHMFLGERKAIVQRLILSETDEERDAALAELLPLQRKDFIRILEAMDGLPVTIRLLDPPLHEFLPDLTELTVKAAVAEQGGQTGVDPRLLNAVRRMKEENPMLGLRGVRLGLVLPGLFALQVRAIAEASCHRRKVGGDPRAEIMIPLVGSVHELDLIIDEASRVLAAVSEENGCSLEFPIGTMIELPRAALTAGKIAGSAQFFSFGTNDLTQTTWGFSRDDVEASFFAQYLDRGIFRVSPFESLDVEGVGRLVEMAAVAGREVRPGMPLGVCGEHGGDPASIEFFDSIDLTYVSCSPFRVPVARLESSRAHLGAGGAASK